MDDINDIETEATDVTEAGDVEVKSDLARVEESDVDTVCAVELIAVVVVVVVCNNDVVDTGEVSLNGVAGSCC